jgi:hypothetical protein
VNLLYQNYMEKIVGEVIVVVVDDIVVEDILVVDLMDIVVAVVVGKDNMALMDLFDDLLLSLDDMDDAD